MKFSWYLILVMLTLPLSGYTDHLPPEAEAGTSINDIALPLTKKTAAELAQVETGGRVLSVDQEQYQNHTIFRVKVLHQDGKVKTYRLDRQTGYQMQ